MNESGTSRDISQEMRAASVQSDWPTALKLSRAVMAKRDGAYEAEILSEISAKEVEYESAVSSCLTAFTQGHFTECAESCTQLAASWPDRDQILDSRFCGRIHDLQNQNQERRASLEALTSEIQALRKRRWWKCAELCRRALVLQPGNTNLVSTLSDCASSTRKLMGFVGVTTVILVLSAVLYSHYGGRDESIPTESESTGAVTALPSAASKSPSLQPHGSLSFDIVWPDVVPVKYRKARKLVIALGDDSCTGLSFPFVTNLVAGKYDLLAELPGYKVNNPSTVVVDLAHTSQVALAVSPKPCSVAFRANVEGVVTITENGGIIGTTEDRVSLAPFVPHVLTFHASGRLKTSKKLTIRNSGVRYKKPISISLAPAPLAPPEP
jgi:hypothetical protein